MKDVDFVLTDIEGTTSDIAFVKDVLFPYSYEHLEAFYTENEGTPEIQDIFKSTQATVAEEDGVQLENSSQVIALLKTWIKEDRKHPALKKLQGMIWKRGYENGDYRAHVYEDVVPALDEWQKKGLQIGVYSSGSVAAQKLFFKHSSAGDLTGYFHKHFDLDAGSKKQQDSYQKIAAEVECPPQRIMFLSDIPAELHAAKDAGLQVLHVVRPGTEKSSEFPAVESFDQIDLK